MAPLRMFQRKLVTSIALACWLFAFFVGVVNACELIGELAVHHHASAADATGHTDQDGADPTGCEHFCAQAMDIPVKPKLFQPQSREQTPLIVPALVAPTMTGVTPVASWLDRPHPPPDLALYVRFLHLAL